MKTILKKSLVIALGAILTMSNVSYAQTYDNRDYSNQYYGSDNYHNNRGGDRYQHQMRNYGPFRVTRMSGRIFTVRDERGNRITIYISGRTQFFDRDRRVIDIRRVRNGDTIRVYGTLSGSRTLNALVIRDLSVSRVRY